MYICMYQYFLIYVSNMHFIFKTAVCISIYGDKINQFCIDENLIYFIILLQILLQLIHFYI